MTTPDLLTVHLFTAQAEARLSGTALPRLQERLGRDGIRLLTHSQAASPPQHPAEGPVVLVSLGGSAGEFPGLWSLSLADRRRWLHVNSVDQVTVEGLVYCWLAATDPLPEPRPVPTSGLSKMPLVSVFTACYRPGMRIRRPYRSLLGQTYRHWEYLILRSLLCTRAVRVPHLLYLQYRNRGGENQTFVRNRQIQILCAQLERYYRPRIQARLTSLGLPALVDLPYRRLWTCPSEDPRWASLEITDQEDPDKRSHLFVYGFEAGPPDTSRLLQVIDQCHKIGWHGREVVVVGRVPEGLLQASARRAPPGSVRWWTTEDCWPLADIERYGRLLCSGRMILESERLEAAGITSGMAWRVPLQYVEHYRPTAPADQGRDRLTVLLFLRERFGSRRYLEIGTDRDEVFAQMNGFDLKVGVDPNAGGTHRMTSDAYFAANRALREDQRECFDLVLIDGLHEYEQVLRDVDHALECLLPGGTIVLHDCMPFEERQQMVPRPRPLGFWTGDVWKAVLVLRQRPDLDIAVGRFDWGVGVLRVRPNPKPFRGLSGTVAEWTWQDYLVARDDGLNVMGFDALQRWIERRDCEQGASD